MSGIVTALTTRNPKSTLIRIMPPDTAPSVTFDDLVAIFSDDLVHYWPFDGTAEDEQGLADATFTGAPELGVPTLVLGDTIVEGAPADGHVVAWSGELGEYAQAPHHAAQKTLSGTIIVYAQLDALNHPAQLIMADAASAAGGLGFGIGLGGVPTAYLRGPFGTPVTVAGIAGEVLLGRAYCFMFKWGGSGLALAIYDDAGDLVRRALDPTMSAGLTGTSAVRFGASHAGADNYDGPYGRVIWLDRYISTVEEDLFASRVKTIQRPSS
jgi:hypothetical protein